MKNNTSRRQIQKTILNTKAIAGIYDITINSDVNISSYNLFCIDIIDLLKKKLQHILEDCQNKL